MISRRGLIVAGAGGLGAGQRRPDQHYGAPAPGLVPGSRTGNLRARSLVLFGTGNGVGLFEYSGTPALGNPPVAYATPPGVTKDPFGNTLPATSGGFTSVSGSIFSQLVNGTVVLRNTSVNAVGAILSAGNPGLAQFASPLETIADTVALLSLFSKAASSGGAAAQGTIVLGPNGPTTTGILEIQGNVTVLSGSIATTGLGVITASGGFNAGVGNVDIPQVGAGLRVAEGSNAKQGTATLVAGTVVVANTSVTANSRIFLTPQDNGTSGALRVSARTPGTSFTILSNAGGDNGVVAYQIFEPG